MMVGVPSVMMVTPAVLRLETEERVVLEAPGLTTATEATLMVQDFPLKRHVLYKVGVSLSPAEGMLATTTIKVCHHHHHPPPSPPYRSLPPPALGSVAHEAQPYTRCWRISTELVGPRGGWPPWSL